MASNADLIMGGFEDAGKALQPYADQQRADQEQNKPLTPYQKALGLMLSGRLSPRDAAIHVQHGLPMDHLDSGVPPAGPQAPGALAAQPQTSGVGPGPSYGYNPGMAQSQAQSAMPIAATPYPAMPPQNRVNPVAGPPAPDSLAPQTHGDYGAMIQALGVGGKDSPTDKMQREILALQLKRELGNQTDTTKKRGQDIRQDLGKQGLEEKTAFHTAMVQYWHDSLQDKMSMFESKLQEAARAISQKHGNNMELEAIKLMAQQYSNIRDNITKIVSSPAATLDEDRAAGTIQTLNDAKAQLGQLELKLEAMRKTGSSRTYQEPQQPQGVPWAPPNYGGSQAPTPTPTQQFTPRPGEAPPLPTSTQVIEPGGGPAPVPQGGPPPPAPAPMPQAPQAPPAPQAQPGPVLSPTVNRQMQGMQMTIPRGAQKFHTPDGRFGYIDPRTGKRVYLG